MFSYYGSKSKIVHLYPEPKHGTIIEPFAGSARYALRFWENDVYLYDQSAFVVEVWKYLINASVDDVLGLPDVPSKVHLDEYKWLSPAERYIIGFHLCRGKAKPRSVGHGQNSWNRDKQRIADNLFKIRHWEVYKASYDVIPNIKATWFIDAPYKNTQERAGNTDRYQHGGLDYDSLGRWVNYRKGQVIVCEGAGAEWLPFTLLTKANGNTNNRTVRCNEEFIYTND